MLSTDHYIGSIAKTERVVKKHEFHAARRHPTLTLWIKAGTHCSSAPFLVFLRTRYLGLIRDYIIFATMVFRLFAQTCSDIGYPIDPPLLPTYRREPSVAEPPSPVWVTSGELVDSIPLSKDIYRREEVDPPVCVEARLFAGWRGRRVGSGAGWCCFALVRLLLFHVYIS
jgi:hypothetical protein